MPILLTQPCWESKIESVYRKMNWSLWNREWMEVDFSSAYFQQNISSIKIRCWISDDEFFGKSVSQLSEWVGLLRPWDLKLSRIFCIFDSAFRKRLFALGSYCSLVIHLDNYIKLSHSLFHRGNVIYISLLFYIPVLDFIWKLKENIFHINIKINTSLNINITHEICHYI